MARNEAVGKARYELETDPTKLKKGLDDAGRTIKQTGAEVEKAFAQQSSSAISRFGQGIDGLVGKFNRIAQGGGIGGAILGGIGLGAGLSAFNMVQGAIKGVMDDVGRSLDLASDKAEAASKANVLFGGSYGILEKASRSAATTVGMSSGAYLAAAGDVGNLLKNMGIAGEAAAGMSKNMLQLAADVGSFNNANPTEVVEAMGAAFRGESDPIQRFGVFLSAAKVEAKAMAMGLRDGKKPLTDYAKAMATYQIILEQTASAQGDFARTADGKANADRIRAAQAEEAWTRLGEVLTPIYQEVMPLIATATTTAIDTITNLATFAAPLVEGALQAIADAIDVIGDSFTALKELMDPTGTEADRVTRAIIEQAKALGLDADAVLAYTEAEKARIRAERERLAIAEQIADLDATIAAVTENARKEIEQYRQAIKDGGDAEALNNIIMERKLQLNTQLAPYLNERDRLLGIQRQAQEQVNQVDAESVRITGLATAAVAAYNERQAVLAQQKQAAITLYGRTATALDEEAAGFSRAASAMNLSYGSVLLATVEAQERAAQDLGPENPDGVAAAVRQTAVNVDRSIDRMFQSMSDAKEPWKAQWRELAAWAKDPFSRDKFEDYIGSRVRQAMRRARESFGAEKQRWLEIARAYRYILKNEWIDPAKADINLIIAALRLADRLATSGTAAGASIEMLGGKKNKRAAGGRYPSGEALVTGEAGWELQFPDRPGFVMDNMASTRLVGALEDIARRPRYTGWTGGGGPQTVDHRISGAVQVELSPATISAARQQGASWEDVGRMVSAADLGALLMDAERDAGSRFTSVRRS